MKNIVVFDEFNELDFKPADLLEEYISLTRKDIGKFLANNELRDIPCPACNSQLTQFAFSRFGMQYKECMHCKTLYISPRPDDSVLNDYYLNSSARKFWQEKLSTSTDKKRKEKIIKPRVDWVIDSTIEYLPGARHWVDVNTSHYGYIDEIAKTDLFARKTLFSPYVRQSSFEKDNIFVLFDKDLANGQIDNEVDVVSLFDVLGHVSDIDAFFAKITRMLKQDGLCFITAILSSGFDILELWEHAENLYPPDRLNVFSMEAIKIIADRFNFDCLEFSTPGILDVDIVLNAIQHNPDIKISRFIRSIIESKDRNVRDAFQEFLQTNLLSSYGRILLRKR